MTAGRTIVPFGEAAVLVELDASGLAEGARSARALASAVAALRPQRPALGAPVATAASVLVPFDPLETDGDAVAQLIDGLEVTLATDAPPANHTIPVRYGGEQGPDLEPVARELGLSPAAVVELHAGTELEVLFLGFAPGFACLGALPDGLRVPRLATPRVRVPAGSVAIAGPMAAIYPQASPGGWRILGRTDLALFDPGATPPARLRPGDRVRFEPMR